MILMIVSSLLLISQMYVHVSAQVLCSNPLTIGELRVLKSKQCVDIPGDDGVGSLQTYKCDGGADQQLILCGDGTIRNQARNYCFAPTGSGNADVVSTSCRHYPSIPNTQKWRLGRTKVFTDFGGISQTATEIINKASGRCLDVQGDNGYGNVRLYDCQNRDDQYFYFRSRGKQVAFGRLRNEKSSQCLDVAGDDGKGNVQMYNCEDKPDQFFRFYENGELINEKSRQCVEVHGSDGNGNVMMYSCADLPDQMWIRPSQLCNGEYCSFVNKKSHKCLDIRGTDGKGDAITWNCEGLPDQRLKFVTDKWTAPTAKWVMVGCNQNGKVSQWISNSVSYSSTVTVTVATEVSASIESDLVFAKGTVSTKVSTSLSSAWTQSREGTTRVIFTCEYYDNEEAFTGGCMWQLQVFVSKRGFSALSKSFLSAISIALFSYQILLFKNRLTSLGSSKRHSCHVYTKMQKDTCHPIWEICETSYLLHFRSNPLSLLF